MNKKKRELLKEQMYYNEIISQTSANKKTFHYIQYLTEDIRFQKEVEIIRSKYCIPHPGFKGPEIKNTDTNNFYYIQDREKFDNTSFYKDVRQLCLNYALEHMWSWVIEDYILHNNIESKVVGDSIIIFDVDSITGSRDNLEYMLYTVKETHPVILLLNPYLSQRDMIDWIKRCHKTMIKPIQERNMIEGIKIGQIKKKKPGVKERNEFIILNKHLPRKVIMKMVGDKFGANSIIDYAYISKIISIENKKRKNL